MPDSGSNGPYSHYDYGDLQDLRRDMQRSKPPRLDPRHGEYRRHMAQVDNNIRTILNDVRLELDYRQEQKEARQRARDERERERDERERQAQADRERQELQRPSGSPAPASSVVLAARSMDRALREYLRSVRGPAKQNFVVDKDQVQWSEGGAKYLGIFTPAPELEVWLKVKLGTSDATLIDEKSYLPANDNKEIARAWSVHLPA